MEDVRKRFAEYKRLKELQRSEPAADKDCPRAGEDKDSTLQHTNNSPGALETQSRDPAGLTIQKTHENSHTLPPPPPPPPLYVTVLKLLLWALLWGFFIEIGFGTVFLITSLLFLLVTSLRGSRRRPWEPSAYSVFNRNCEAIKGTLSAEQFERELRYGPMSVKQ